MPDLGKFVHLHVHSSFSTLDGACRIDGLVARCRELGMGSVALTDHGNLFGALSFQKACQKGGIKPILGCETYFAPTSHTDRTSQHARTRYHFLMLCETTEGYTNLSRLVSTGYLKGFYYKPRIDMDLIQAYSKGLIATTTCLQGPVCQMLLEGRTREAQEQLDNFLQVFGRDNFFVEIMDHGLAEQKKVNDELIRIARRDNLPMIATNDCHYLTADDYDAHDVMLCVQTGKQIDSPDRLRFDRNEFYIKSPEAMIKDYGHLEGAIENTLKIAERCNAVIPTGQRLLPKFVTPDGSDVGDHMRGLLQAGLRKRYGDRLGTAQLERADFEADVIEKMGFVDYFLVVADFIRWAKDRGIPVGPGRGSGAGSIVAYCLEITGLDPLEHGLLFERFLNPERVSMPDFDIDFCFERRGEVIEYVRQKYGPDCVAQIITFGTMKAKNSIRDVGRVMGVPLSRVNDVAKLVPGGPNVTLSAVLGEIDESKYTGDKADKLEELKKQYSQEFRELYDSDAQVRELIDRARGIEGAIRQPGTHAAGVVICDRPLIDLIPLYQMPGENQVPATQFTMGEVEEIGLLKMDFLGLKNLTLIEHCLQGINKRTGQKLTPESIPFDDAETYRLLQSGKGLGLFQLESAGMRQLLVQFKPTRFSDLVALISLYRPGPMDNIPDFIKRKEGTTPVVYDHPSMEPILNETYGLFVYQEQVMQCAQVVGGYTLGGADLLRRAMGKKKAEEMAKERQKFVAGAIERGLSDQLANSIYDTMAKFAGYGFNKSHAAAYAVVTVQTSWLKAHYPVDFYSALISNEIGGDDAKLAAYFEEVRDEGISILPPAVNTSGVTFSPDGENIRFGLSAIKGVGEGAVRAIIEEREKNGPFKTLQDFVTRCDKKQINARVVECLIKCGAFDWTGHNRPSLLEAMPKILELAGSARKDADSLEISLFDMMSEEQTASLGAEVPIPKRPDWDEKAKLDTEKELAGFFLSGHPLDRFKPDFSAFSTHTAAQITHLRKGDQVEWVGLVKRLVPRMDKNGSQFCFAECEDITGPMEVTVFSRTFADCRAVLREGEVIWVKGRIDIWRDAKKIIADEVKCIDDAREQKIRIIEVELPWRNITEANLAKLGEIVSRHRGRRAKLWFVVRDGAAEVRLAAGSGFGVMPQTKLIRELQDLQTVQNLRFINGHSDADG